jgi:hypothetical protein
VEIKVINPIFPINLKVISFDKTNNKDKRGNKKSIIVVVSFELLLSKYFNKRLFISTENRIGIL